MSGLTLASKVFLKPKPIYNSGITKPINKTIYSKITKKPYTRSDYNKLNEKLSNKNRDIAVDVFKDVASLAPKLFKINPIVTLADFAFDGAIAYYESETQKNMARYDEAVKKLDAIIASQGVNHTVKTVDILNQDYAKQLDEVPSIQGTLIKKKTLIDKEILSKNIDDSADDTLISVMKTNGEKLNQKLDLVNESMLFLLGAIGQNLAKSVIISNESLELEKNKFIDKVTEQITDNNQDDKPMEYDELTGREKALNDSIEAVKEHNRKVQLINIAKGADVAKVEVTNSSSNEEQEASMVLQNEVNEGIKLINEEKLRNVSHTDTNGNVIISSKNSIAIARENNLQSMQRTKDENEYEADESVFGSFPSLETLFDIVKDNSIPIDEFYNE